MKPKLFLGGADLFVKLNHGSLIGRFYFPGAVFPALPVPICFPLHSEPKYPGASVESRWIMIDLCVENKRPAPSRSARSLFGSGARGVPAFAPCPPTPTVGHVCPIRTHTSSPFPPPPPGGCAPSPLPLTLVPIRDGPRLPFRVRPHRGCEEGGCPPCNWSLLVPLTEGIPQKY